MKNIILSLILCSTFNSIAREQSNIISHGPKVIPILLDVSDFDRGEDVWFECVYSGSPKGEVIHEEIAEKIWWIQDKPLLLLGSTGLSLPSAVTSRTSAYVKIFFDGEAVKGSPFKLEPRKEGVVIGPDAKNIQSALGKRLLSLDATYLSQVANFLAQNVAALEVQGTSYSVDGYGQVISSAGEWTGEVVSVNQDVFKSFTGNTGITTADTNTDTLNIVGSGLVNTAITGDTLTITATEVDGDASNELQNIFQTVWANSGTTTADSQTDILTIIGSGSVATSLVGDKLTIKGIGITSEVDGSITNELQNLYSTIASDSGSSTANTQTDTLTISGSGPMATNTTGDTLEISIENDSLDFSLMKDSMTLDATTSVNMDTHSADLNLDDDTLVIDSSENRVGVGTSAPQDQLHVAGGSLLQTPGDPKLVGSLDLGLAGPTSVYVSGRYAYVADWSGHGMKILDVTDPTDPREVSHIGSISWPTTIYVSGRYAYVGDIGSNVLRIIDISNPHAPNVVGYINGIASYKVYVSGCYAYVLDWNTDSIKIIDISVPSDPSVVGTLALAGRPHGLYVSGAYAYLVSNISDDLQVINISDPRVPTLVGNIGIGSDPTSIYVSGSFAYVTDSTSNDLKVINVSDPSTPSLAGTIDGLSYPTDIHVSGRYAYIVDKNNNVLKMIDVSDPSIPLLVGSLVIGDDPTSIYVSGRYAYVVDKASRDLKVIDVSGAEVTSLMAHSLEAGNLQVQNDIIAQGQLQVTGGVNIGSGGMFSDGNIGVSGSLSLTNDIVPTSSPENMVQLYAEDNASSSELKVRDEAGNITTLSPHNFSLIGEPSEPLAWSYYSEKGNSAINVDMLKLARLVEKLSGEKLVYSKSNEDENENTESLVRQIQTLELKNQQLIDQISRIEALLGIEN